MVGCAERYFRGKHVVITGGSEGIGYALAGRLSAIDCKISLVARTKSKLEAAAGSLAAAAAAAAAHGRPGDSGLQVFVAPADVTQYQQVEDALAACTSQHGPVDVLICCAGAAECGYFHQQAPAVFQSMMQLNYMGCVHAAKAVAAGMLSRNSGHICFVASSMALIGFVGYSAYAPSKYAVRGLAECLRNEFQGTGVAVSVAFPGDVDTPGYARENLTKPRETAKLSEGTLNPPDKVAASILKGMARRQFQLANPVMLLELLQTACAGVVPRSLLRLPVEMLLGFLLPVICWATSAEHDALCRRTAGTRYAGLWGGS